MGETIMGAQKRPAREIRNEEKALLSALHQPTSSGSRQGCCKTGIRLDSHEIFD